MFVQRRNAPQQQKGAHACNAIPAVDFKLRSLAKQRRRSRFPKTRSLIRKTRRSEAQSPRRSAPPSFDLFLFFLSAPVLVLQFQEILNRYANWKGCNSAKRAFLCQNPLAVIGYDSWRAVLFFFVHCARSIRRQKGSCLGVRWQTSFTSISVLVRVMALFVYTIVHHQRDRKRKRIHSKK